MSKAPWDDLPRINLAYLPTPLYEAKRLSAELGGPRILIKRDDLTGGQAITGNKVRKCEFLLAESIVARSTEDVCGKCLFRSLFCCRILSGNSLGLFLLGFGR